MDIKNKYDVVIAGGGLAGLTLALQLKQTQPGISVLVLEKRSENAPVATHKVGESLSELGASYLREVLDLKDYLNENQLRKFGFRFFFSPEHHDNLARRVEVGSRISNPYPSHQVDRGLLENALVQKVTDYGADIMLGARVIDVELSKAGHTVFFEKENSKYQTKAAWIVDSTGRNGLLKRKLGLNKEMDHDINSAWFRLDTAIDIDYWSDDLEWRGFTDPGRRRLATNHLMGEGYWVWIIPLFEDMTSIGIVADPVYHPFDTFNTFEKAMVWLEKHEPLAARKLGKHRDRQMDFKVMKHFAYDTKQFYSADKWALTGEAGAFMDPFYSPGSDFIALSNSWITDLIVRDTGGENTAMRTLVYDLAHKELLRGWVTLYRNMYGLFGKTQIMLMKIVWDWAAYWAIPNVLFINKGYTDIDILKQYSSSATGTGSRFSKLNERMQALFRQWGSYHNQRFSDYQLNVFDLTCLHQFQVELGKQYRPADLMNKVESNLEILEQLAAEIFRRVSEEVYETPADMPVDPYNMTLDDGKDELLRKSESQHALGVTESIRTDIERMWLKNIKPSRVNLHNSVSANMEYIQKIFLEVQAYMRNDHTGDAVIAFLDGEPPVFRSVAYESASMEIALQELSAGKDLTNWMAFYLRAAKAHTFHMDIGLGWAFAKAEISPAPFLESLHPVMSRMVYDGMGYYYGLFKGRKTVKSQMVPAEIHEQELHGFDQGLGRRLWYICKGEVEELLKLLHPFPPSRQADLWRGVGIATGYVGGNNKENLERLLESSAGFKQELSTGVTLAAISRHASGSITRDIESACGIICGMPLTEVLSAGTGSVNKHGPERLAAL